MASKPGTAPLFHPPLEPPAILCLIGPMSETDLERKKRLAEALRTNLRRRKAQARAADAQETPPPAAPAPRD